MTENEPATPRFFCKSCRDVIRRSPDVTVEIRNAMRSYCFVCALELLGIAIPKYGTLQHGTGGGWRVIRETKTH